MSSNLSGQGELFVIAAPSGGGKTSLVNALLKQDSRLVLSISHTTRSPRPGEVDGQHYHFVSKSAFEQMIDNGDFMEHAQVFDNYYGSNRKSVASQLHDDKDVVLEIDWQGARQVRKAFPNCCQIYILPPSLETLQQRLTARGQDSETVIHRRMRDAQAEISHWAEFDQLVINDNFELAIEELHTIIEDHRNNKPHFKNKAHEHLAQKLGNR
jgi:guanylate kinase